MSSNLIEFTPEQVKTAISPAAQAIKSGAKGAKGSIKEIASGRSDIFRVNPFLIDVEPGFNARDFDTLENKEGIALIADSIAHEGVREALLVRMGLDGRLKLVNGERRLRGTLLAINILGKYAGQKLDEIDLTDPKNMPSVPVRLEPKGTTEIDRIASQRLLNTSVPFTIYEDAKIVSQLLRFGLDAETIYQKTLMTPVYQARALKAAERPEAAKAFVRNGEVAATLVEQLAQTSSSEQELVTKLEQAVETAKKQGKRRATAKHVEGGPRSTKREMKDLLEMISNQGKIDASRPGKVVIEFTDEEYAKLKEVTGARI